MVADEDRVFKALADASRRQLLDRLRKHEIALRSEMIDAFLAAEPQARVAAETLTMVQPDADRAQVRLSLQMAGEVAARADRLRLRQVLLNLLSNAIKFNREAGTVRVALLPDGEGVRVQSRRQLYAQGILVNLTNPKAIVFIAALVPQFIVPDRPQWPQFAIIGATMVGVDVMVMSCYALLATRFRPLLRDPRLLRLQNRLFGGLFVGAGAILAASSR